MKKNFLQIVIFFVLFFGSVFAAAPTVSISSPAVGQYLKNSNSAIVFTVNDSDINGLPNQDLNAKLYYSATAGTFTNLIGDFNLMNTAYCGNADFNSATQTCTIPWTISIGTDGNYFVDLNVYKYDDAGSALAFAVSSSGSFVVDNTKPIVLADYNNAWQKTDANVLFGCTDATSGCASITANSNVTVGAAANLLVSSDGNNAVTFFATDASGNQSDSNTIYVLLDKTAPTTNSDTNSYWQNSDVNVHLTCNDNNRSGCKTTYYRIDSDSGSGTSYSALLVFDQNIFLNSDGNWGIEFFSTDNLDNNESSIAVAVLIDRVAPSIPSLNNPGTGDGQISLSWTSSTDDNSGVKEYVVYRNGSAVGVTASTNYTDTGLSNGTSYSFKVKARDNALNEGGFSNEVSATPVSSNSNNNNNNTGSLGTSVGTANNGVTLNLQIIVSDLVKAEKVSIILDSGSISDMQGYQLKITKQGKATETISNLSFVGKRATIDYVFKQGEDGNVLLEATAWNGRVRTDVSKKILVDATAPTIELVEPKQNETLAGKTQLKAIANDKAGLKQVAFYYQKKGSTDWNAIGVGAKIDGNNWVIDWDTTTLADSDYNVKATAMDFVGNTTDKTVSVKLSNIALLGIKGTATVEKILEFTVNTEDAKAMLETILKSTVVKDIEQKTIDNNVSRILKVIKVVDDANKESYRVSVFLSFRNNGNASDSFQLVEIVPKEFAQKASEIESNVPFAIMEEDPVIVWNLQNVRVGKTIEITYSLKAAMTKETAMKIADSNIMQKFVAPPIISLASNPIKESDFKVSFGNANISGFFGFLTNPGLLAIIVGLVIAALAATIIYNSRKSSASIYPFEPKSDNATADDWSYKEPFHKGITEKIGSVFDEYIGYKETETKKKWVVDEAEIKVLGTEKKNAFEKFFDNVTFLLSSKTEKNKAEGKAKWSANYKDNSDI